MAQHFAKEEINCQKFAKYLQKFAKSGHTAETKTRPSKFDY